ncbi:MAG: hypothetical protein VYA30_04420 [Myxococcota bacterium]|nr:hypothetical protein [Myxococcota bacterium]
MRCVFLLFSFGLASACSASLDYGDPNRFDVDATEPQPVMSDAQIPRDTGSLDPEDSGPSLVDADTSDMGPSSEDAGTQADDSGFDMDANSSIDHGSPDAETERDSTPTSDSATEMLDSAVEANVDAALDEDSSTGSSNGDSQEAEPGPEETID